MSGLFANRGQMLQLIVAIAALIVSIIGVAIPIYRATRDPNKAGKAPSGRRWWFRMTAALLIIVTLAIGSSLLDLLRNRDREKTIINEPTLPSPVTNSIGLTLVYIPPGKFMMGSTNGESDERPIHEVLIDRGFYLSRTEITQAQWRKIMGNNPAQYKGDDHPVADVSWFQVQEFLIKLNNLGDGYFYRLPSESEWEYACRAGTTGDYAVDALELGAWYANNSGRRPLDSARIWRTNKDNYAAELLKNRNTTHPVAQKQPNKFGLYDMHGNVWEWCADYYHENYSGAPNNGNAWVTGGDMRERVTRGGSRGATPAECRSSKRNSSSPGNIGNDVGFRVVAQPQ
ncbi:MAG TPA: formylglycine-generating enzyme family protein [Pyrinomonadaceae bacterium]|nr:formylglycine-generating enzyme family protein [Pyrinomonadaceae bacterium]